MKVNLPAFPLPQQSPWGGMSLRDYFAAKAMQAFIQRGQFEYEEFAKAAYYMADAMMKEREK